MRSILYKLLKHGMKIGSVLMLLLVVCSCDSLLDIEDSYSLVPRDRVFKTDAIATSAITGMYASMLETSNFASGSGQSVTALASLSSDDFTIFDETQLEYFQFERNEVLPNSSLISSLWTSSYQIIYQANSAIVSLTNSSSVSAPVKEQLLGEALFVRAFTYFNLVNMFGGVPIITGIDYNENNVRPRASVDAVYKLIEDDLLQAQSLLSKTYPSKERVRPNRAVATALLARVYLYKEDWLKAEVQASLIIEDPTYILEDDLNNVFLSTSSEAIWQLRPIDRGINTLEGLYFILTGTPSQFYLTQNLIDSFEGGDSRLSHWTAYVESDGGTFYFPYKYKIQYGGPGSTPPEPLSEYSMVFRLAEQYLIRAEARAKQDRLGEAIADIDMIRDRADLLIIADINPTIDKDGLLLAIEQERRNELFTEWGHRWFDLKRTERATAVLGTDNANWSENDLLYPLPANEFRSNPRLGDQNPGY